MKDLGPARTYLGVDFIGDQQWDSGASIGKYNTTDKRSMIWRIADLHKLLYLKELCSLLKPRHQILTSLSIAD